MSSSNAAAFPQQMVSGAGTIYVPFAGKILVAGKTLEEIESDITRQLQGKANQPQVLVRLVTNNTACATVIGEVASSTRLPLTPRGERLLDALAAAGGTRQPVEKITLQLTRGTSVRALPLDTVIRDPRQNIPLQPGDVVTALYQPLSFTALGAAGKSDEVNFEAQGISLAQALARAGGVLDNRSDAEGVFIFRFESKDTLKFADAPPSTPDGKIPVIYRVNLKDPRAFFVAQSFPMENKDVLYVANAPAAQLQKFLNLIVSTVYPIQGVVTLTK
jgi:polysaccharide export outer membrane protein